LNHDNKPVISTKRGTLFGVKTREGIRITWERLGGEPDQERGDEWKNLKYS